MEETKMSEKKIIIDYDEFLELQGIKDAQMNKVTYPFSAGRGRQFILFMDPNEAMEQAVNANHELVLKIEELSDKIEQLKSNYYDLVNGYDH